MEAEFKKVPTVNALHEVFNTSEAVKCPLCSEIVNQLLDMEFILGNQQEMEAFDYAKGGGSDVAVYSHK